MIEIGPFRPGDRAAWEELARGYQAFYQDPMPDEAVAAAARERGADRFYWHTQESNARARLLWTRWPASPGSSATGIPSRGPA